MKTTFTMLAICPGLLVSPVGTSAASTTAASQATMMCRPALNVEKPTAVAGSTGIVCKSIAQAMSKRPDTTGMPADGAKAAYATGFRS
jgi:hypothetical protein